MEFRFFFFFGDLYFSFQVADWTLTRAVWRELGDIGRTENTRWIQNMYLWTMCLSPWSKLWTSFGWKAIGYGIWYLSVGRLGPYKLFKLLTTELVVIHYSDYFMDYWSWISFRASQWYSSLHDGQSILN